MDTRVYLMFSFQKYTSFFVYAVLGILFFCAPASAKNSSQEGWMVQLSSFKEEKNAERFVSYIKKKGYTPFVLREEGSKWFKVRVGPYPSEEEAEQVVKDLKNNQGISALVVYAHESPPVVKDQGDSIDIVVSQLLIWLEAWEGGQVNTYLSFYSENFKDANKSRKEWAAQRRSTLGQNSSITIQISDIQMKQKHDSVEMSFVQDFKSDTVSNVGRKEMIWKNEGDSWKIIKEIWKRT